MRMTQRYHKDKSIPSCRKKPIFIFCYHKTGTVLFSKIFTEISKKFNLNFTQIYGYVHKLPEEVDIVLFSHAVTSKEITSSDFIGIHIIRDPRDILISGYLYHLRTKELWCTTSLNHSKELKFPIIPTFKENASEHEKLCYLKQFKNESYQNKLQELSKDEGILFELNNYSGWTIDCIRNWDFKNPKILELKLENISNQFDNTFKDIFKWLGFQDTEIETCLEIAQKEDINRMGSEKKHKNNHISNEGLSKWEKYLSPKHKEIFKNRYPNLISHLGYEDNETW